MQRDDRVAERRIAWLEGQAACDIREHFKPQAWVFLGQRLAAEGYHDDARTISIARRRRERRSHSATATQRRQELILDLFALYGYNPWRTVLWMAGVVLVPGAAYLWVVALGVASGGMFALVLTLPLDLEHEPRQVGALVGMMLGLGYTIGAVSPVVLGAVRDVSGSFTASLWLLVAFAALLLLAVAALPRRDGTLAA